MRPHTIHTSVHSLHSSYNEGKHKRPGGPSRQWDCEATCTERIQRARGGSARGAAQGGARHGRRGRTVVICWHQCWQTGRCWTCCAAGYTAAIAFVRGVRASRCVWGMCCPCRPLSWPATCPPVLRLVRIHQSRCLFGCACRRAPADKRIAQRWRTRAWHRDRTKNELRAWPGCREPAQRPAHGAT